jgi:myo-inositol-1(or 4)-monophosphatase
MILNVQDLKRIGPASVDICRVAEGVVDGYFELDLEVWDIGAASLILEEAGGKITDWFGNSREFKRSPIVASNGKIADDILKILSKK